MNWTERTSSGGRVSDIRLKKVKDKKEQRREAAAKIEAEKQGLKKDSEEKDLITMIQE